MKSIHFWIIFLVHLTLNASVIEDKRYEVLEHEPFVVVGLGVDCQLLMHMMDHDLYLASFPVDWMVTFHTNEIIRLIDCDFKDLMDFKQLKIINLHHVDRVIHDNYDIEMPHILDIKNWQNTEYGLRPIEFEGDILNEASIEEIQAIKTKYERRIRRWNRLESLKKPVYFIRYYVHAEHYDLRENIALYDSLKRKFPNLEFKLYVVQQYNLDRPTIQHEDIIFEYINPKSNINIRSREEPHVDFVEFFKRVGWIN